MIGSQRRVVITGLGLVTPLGDSPDRLWGSLVEGKGAVRPIEAFPVAGLSSNLGAEIRHFDFLKTPALAKAKFIKELRKSRKYMARDIQLCVTAAQLAFVDAGLDQGGVDPTRVGIDLGAGLISTELDELAPAICHATPHPGGFDFPAWGRESIGMIEPIWLLKYLPNMLACHISILMDCQGPSNTITEGDASSNLAIAEAARIIARGKADVMIAGGADSKIHPLSFVRLNLHHTMSHWRGEHSGACRPFDLLRDGTVPGEGAGVLILEDREHALRRGAVIHGEVLGAGSGCDSMPGGGLDPQGSGTEIAVLAAPARGWPWPRSDRSRERSRPGLAAGRSGGSPCIPQGFRDQSAARDGAQGFLRHTGFRLRRRGVDRQSHRGQSGVHSTNAQLRRSRSCLCARYGSGRAAAHS